MAGTIVRGMGGLPCSAERMAGGMKKNPKVIFFRPRLRLNFQKWAFGEIQNGTYPKRPQEPLGAMVLVPWWPLRQKNAPVGSLGARLNWNSAFWNLLEEYSIGI